MAKNQKLSTGFRNTLIDGGDISTMFDGGKLYVFDGLQPPNADSRAATSGIQKVLAIIDLPGTNAFEASAVDGKISKAGTWEELSAPATGIAKWFRLYANPADVATGSPLDDTDSILAVRVDGTVGVSNADLILDTVSIVTGADVPDASFTLSFSFIARG